MPTNSSRFFLTRLLLQATQTNRRGFTLTELLVTILIGSIVMSGLLFLVVELMQINRREEVLTETQQDMKRAIDYISRDAREAVFVYSTPAKAIKELDDLPTGEPILAFWRLDPVDTSSIGVCSTAFSGNLIKQGECNTLKVRQSAYTLVVYMQEENKDGDIWGGPSKIVRYELPKYTGSGVNSLTQSPGYLDPSLNQTGFADWIPSSTATDGNSAVLSDYIDAFVDDDSEFDACPTNYQRTPSTTNTSFYACVRTGEVGNNQSLLVFLRGNATSDRPGIVTFSDASRLPTLQSEVLVRGVLDKNPD